MTDEVFVISGPNCCCPRCGHKGETITINRWWEYALIPLLLIFTFWLSHTVWYLVIDCNTLSDTLYTQWYWVNEFIERLV